MYITVFTTGLKLRSFEQTMNSSEYWILLYLYLFHFTHYNHHAFPYMQLTNYTLTQSDVDWIIDQNNLV